MATSAVSAQPPSDQKNYGLPKPMKEQQAWIVKYIEETHAKDAKDVVVVGIPGFKGGGGGLYCKTDDLDKNYNAMKEAAMQAGGTEQETAKGKFLLVRNDGQKPGEKAATCFILWHEFGHALADRGVGSNAGEASAWRFELQAITHAVTTGLPPGITKDMVWGYLDVRRKGNLTGMDDLINALEVALGSRATLITEGYCHAAKRCAVTNLGDFDPDKFKSAIKAKWPNLTAEDLKTIKTVTGVTL